MVVGAVHAARARLEAAALQAPAPVVLLVLLVLLADAARLLLPP